MVIPRSFFGMLLMGTAAPLAIASAVMPTRVNLAPRQQPTADEPTVTGYDWNEFIECTSLMEEIADHLRPTPPPEIPRFWFTHPLVQDMMETYSDEPRQSTDPAAIAEQCSAEYWRDTKLIPNEKEDGKELVQAFQSWTDHTKEIKSKYRSGVYSLATKCAHIGTLPGDIDVEAMAGWMMSAVATNEQECASAMSIMSALTTVDGASVFGGPAPPTTTTTTRTKTADTADSSISTAGAWRGRETGVAVAVVAGMVGAVVGL
ncbi:hypothetical protein QBC41DRAFT_100408 [Cercophora samala]|uniref:Infection structure specific protein n=1 Tax=Cercophora samala TaxID=330535 RepID=A0AA40DD85_9PEZI|nr:hypothetical protein QBC41DRAFT_100408 [Cercophora samala]